MAVVTGPLHSSEARGQIGGITGLVYNTHRGRSYVKANALPAIEYSDLQIYTRGLMAEVYDCWLNLTEAQRAPWAHFAEENHLCDWTGNLKQLSGWNWYAKANFKLLQAGAVLITAPPFPITSYVFSDLFFTSGIPQADVTWTPASPSPDPNWFIQIWTTLPHRPTAHPSFKLAHLLGVVDEDLGTYPLDTTEPGTQTLYLVPLSAQGITMPPVRLLAEIT